METKAMKEHKSHQTTGKATVVTAASLCVLLLAVSTNSGHAAELTPDGGISADAIVGSGKNAIVGSGKNAIVGSGKNGSDLETDAIVGSGKNAIVGSGKNAIVGSGKNGSDLETDAIVGSGKNAFESDSVFGPVLSGPVAAVDEDTSSITVLGQSVVLTEATRSPKGEATNYQLGDWITVTGLTTRGTVFASTITVSPKVFIPGVSEVFAAGTITDINLITGRLAIGEAVFNVVELNAEESDLEVGSYVEITAVLPQPSMEATATSLVIDN
jgi:hypothetical protein